MILRNRSSIVPPAFSIFLTPSGAFPFSRFFSLAPFFRGLSNFSKNGLIRGPFCGRREPCSWTRFFRHGFHVFATRSENWVARGPISGQYDGEGRPRRELQDPPRWRVSPYFIPGVNFR